jgi:hypothetical protein
MLTTITPKPSNGRVSMYPILKEILIKVTYVCKYVTNFVEFDIKLQNISSSSIIDISFKQQTTPSMTSKK